jgi:cytochrome c1
MCTRVRPVAFLALGYLGTQLPTPAYTLLAQACTLLYFSFFLLMPWWSAMGRFKPVPTACHVHPALTQDSQEPKDNHEFFEETARGPGLAAGIRVRQRRDVAARPRAGTQDIASLQNGAKLFVNYCLNCHSASSMRYNRLRDLGLNEDQIKNNLLFSGEKVGDMMTIAMRPADAKAWFGAVPPDLSVIARAKSGAAAAAPTTCTPICALL